MLRSCLFPLFLLVFESDGIINGQEAAHREFPYAASVTLLGTPVGAGIILSMSFVVSPCHLFAEFNGNGDVTSTCEESEVRVFAGSVFSDVVADENQQHRVPDLILLHPLCHNSDFFINYDFAVLRLPIPFFPSLSIEPFQMPSGSERILEALALKMNSNGLCTVVGWGAQTVNFSDNYINPSDVLKKTQVRLIDWEECSYRLCKYPKRFCDVSLPESGAICALPLHGGSNCAGDDGGALICDSSVFGFASIPVSCGELLGKPNLFARFDVAFDFLTSQCHL